MKWRDLVFSASSIAFLLLCILLGFLEHPLITHSIKTIIFVYLIFIVFRTVFFFFGSFKEKLQDYFMDQRNQDEFNRPMVSIIVPAYNEEADIAYCLESLSQIDYPNFEIILVDDGSTDSTFAIASHYASMQSHIPIKVIHQTNQGKAKALNHGIFQAMGDLILCVDADSRINDEALKKGVRHFERQKVGAVAGFVDIANTRNLILKLQQLEYLVGLNFTRRALSFLGIVPIVPGPAGMFRREALLECGGYKSGENVYAEDAELSLRLLSYGWEVRSEEDLISTTEAPENIRDLLRQRYRWNRGTYQALRQNSAILKEKQGIRGRWLSAYLWGETVITPNLNMGLILYFFSYFIASGQLQIFTTWYLYLLCLDAFTTLLVTYKHGNPFKWLALTLLNKFFYYYLLLTWRLISLHEEWHSEEMTWDKLERTGQLGEIL